MKFTSILALVGMTNAIRLTSQSTKGMPGAGGNYGGHAGEVHGGHVDENHDDHENHGQCDPITDPAGRICDPSVDNCPDQGTGDSENNGGAGGKQGAGGNHGGHAGGNHGGHAGGNHGGHSDDLEAHAEEALAMIKEFISTHEDDGISVEDAVAHLMGHSDETYVENIEMFTHGLSHHADENGDGHLQWEELKRADKFLTGFINMSSAKEHAPIALEILQNLDISGEQNTLASVQKQGQEFMLAHPNFQAGEEKEEKMKAMTNGMKMLAGEDDIVSPEELQNGIKLFKKLMKEGGKHECQQGPEGKQCRKDKKKMHKKANKHAKKQPGKHGSTTDVMANLV